jgi:hypothetical protein
VTGRDSLLFPEPPPPSAESPEDGITAELFMSRLLQSLPYELTASLDPGSLLSAGGAEPFLVAESWEGGRNLSVDKKQVLISDNFLERQGEISFR